MADAVLVIAESELCTCSQLLSLSIDVLWFRTVSTDTMRRLTIAGQPECLFSILWNTPGA